MDRFAFGEGVGGWPSVKLRMPQLTFSQEFKMTRKNPLPDVDLADQ